MPANKPLFVDFVNNDVDVDVAAVIATLRPAQPSTAQATHPAAVYF